MRLLKTLTIAGLITALSGCIIVTDRDDFTDAVIDVLEALQPGEVIAYGEVAAEAGYPGAARAVGNLLRTTPGLPWWPTWAAHLASSLASPS